jgi:tetratricopeptide (TPR) repeat protein
MTHDEIKTLVMPFYGYLELGMDDDANDALDSLPDKLKSHPLVLSARLDQLMVLKKWEDGVSLGQSLCKLWPDGLDMWFRTAFCLHELKRTEEAKQTLLCAPEEIRKTPLFSYNLACYEAQLGRRDEARSLLEECFRKDLSMRADALDDPDLEPVWKFL